MDSNEDLQAAIDNLHTSVVYQTGVIIEKLSAASQSSSSASSWVEYVNQLNWLVPSYATPVWLGSAIETFGNTFTATSQNTARMAKFITLRNPEIVQPILIGEEANLDLDQLFSEQSERFKLNQVFENLVKRLSELIKADVIESRIVHESLQRLNALFRRNKNGSLATILMTMNFGRFFLNSFGDTIKTNKYAKTIIENFEKEFAEASLIVEEAQQETKKEMISRLVSAERIQLYIESNPGSKEAIAGFLPAAREVHESSEIDSPNGEELDSDSPNSSSTHP